MGAVGNRGQCGFPKPGGRGLGVHGAGSVHVFVLITAVTAAAVFSARVDASLLAQTGACVRMTRQRTRAALVSAQVAVALVLLAGATLFVRSLQSGLSLNPRSRHG